MKNIIFTQFRRYFWFIGMWGLLLIGLFFVTGNTQMALWVGFVLAAISTIGNDSIQTLGTFLSSNKDIPWWVLWLYIGGIFILVMFYGWWSTEGVDFGRLDAIPRPESLTMIQLLAPAVLFFMTKFRIPVSTTFLILSVFATGDTIDSMLAKTFLGYLIAFLCGIGLWTAGLFYLEKFFHGSMSDTQKNLWRGLQWAATTMLWVSWLMQNNANMVIFMPEDISLIQVSIMAGIVFTIIGVIFWMGGGPIQGIIQEKTDVKDVRSATLIDLSLALILFFFKEMSTIPMSTTWVFLGLLAGRELAYAYYYGENHTLWDFLRGKNKKSRKAFFMLMKDIMLASVGVIISIILVLLTKI